MFSVKITFIVVGSVISMLDTLILECASSPTYCSPSISTNPYCLSIPFTLYRSFSMPSIWFANALPSSPSVSVVFAESTQCPISSSATWSALSGLSLSLLLSRIVFASLANAPFVPGSSNSVQIISGESSPATKSFKRFWAPSLNAPLSVANCPCSLNSTITLVNSPLSASGLSCSSNSFLRSSFLCSDP